MIYALLLTNTVLLIVVWLSLRHGIRRAAHRIVEEIQDMSAELLAAVAAVGEKVELVSADLQAEIAQINEAIAALQQPDPDVAAAIASLQGIASNLDAVDSSVKGIIPDVPVEPPAPEPAPEA